MDVETNGRARPPRLHDFRVRGRVSGLCHVLCTEAALLHGAMHGNGAVE